MLHEIMNAETKDDAPSAAGEFEQEFAAKYPKAVACLTKELSQMLTFYDFPAEHWRHLRTPSHCAT